MQSLDVSALRAGYASGELTPLTVIDEVCDRIEAGEGAIWISRFSRDELRAAARALEGKLGLPLYGVPFAVKDNID
ncbi:MAG TPA: amidase family protein, partial [Polyangia bacterium]|nr:amidase family protein [Polyangia bacterium]